MDLQAIPNQLDGKRQFEVKELRNLFPDILDPKANIFWTDFLLSAAGGWSAFVWACLTKPMSWQMFVSVAVSAICLYRALAFLHEISHLTPKTLPGFAKVWNLLVGIPLLIPSFVYIGVHVHHHRLSSYGTASDPEYMPFSGKRGAIIFFIAQNFLMPALLLLRFLLLSPLGLLLPSLHRFLEHHASSACTNPAYYREISDNERANMMAMELLIIAFWTVPIMLAVYGVVPWRIFLIWYEVTVCIELTRCLQALGAHRYRSSGEPMDIDSVLLDSIDTPGNFWTEIWAPLGLRYHALHHCCPNIPYHNLHIAYQRLKEYLPVNSFYHSTTSLSLRNSLQTLWNENTSNGT
ncbi:fatty acid desaturase family protein [Nostoc commune]|uniref:fatty acid desaturase family protein n=1 Tax=Nostoc commune TaxID=1178 RepID=UPI0018C787B2|nr:fatty acid desaturase [Nostoc commune]MBG1261433.1 fatty acid desaturase [Nostoc commune BAE]